MSGDRYGKALIVGGENNALDFLDLPGVRTLSKTVKLNKDGREFYHVIAETTDPVVHHPCDALHWRIHERRKFVATDWPRGPRPVKIEFRRRWYKCLSCEARGQSTLFKEELPHIARGKRQTERAFKDIVVEGSDATFRKTGKRYGISDRNAGGTFHRVLDRYQDRIEQAPRVLGLDEKKLAGRKRGIVCDINQRRLLAVTDDDLKAFEAYLRLMPGREKTEYVTLDMREGFISLAQELFPQAIVIIDKFHVLQRGNIALTRFIGSLRRNKKIQNPDGKRLLVGAGRLLSKHTDGFRPDQLERVARIFRAWPDVEAAYQCKEEFYEFYDAADRRDALDKYLEWELNVPQRSYKYFKKHTFLNPRLYEYILNYFIGLRTNAFTENRNRRLADIGRDGRALTLDTIVQKATFDEKRIDISSDPYGLACPPSFNTRRMLPYFIEADAGPIVSPPVPTMDPNHPTARRIARREKFLRKRRQGRGDPPKLVFLNCCRAA